MNNEVLDKIKNKIKALDNKKLFDIIKVKKDDDIDELIEITLISGYREYPLDDFGYNAFIELLYDNRIDKIEISSCYSIIYDELRSINNIPLINFTYENLDKIKTIIKNSLESKYEK